VIGKNGGETMEHVIYASYGSNLLEERFLVYINSGKFRNKGTDYPGCEDKTQPQYIGWILVPYRIYFAKNSPRWDNGGVAFLSYEREPKPEFHSVVRLWKVFKSQFNDIKEQEGYWYDKILCIGEIDGLKILTFTESNKSQKTNPSKSYLEVIIEGLKETTAWSDEKINKYWEKFLK
jgi:hypothetical protein